ncbi:helix-turn-helix domain-containing protein [Paenibacillus silvisoli]|uniref:helix-turn-helix domain-containing protein n=1 Tax=Paenibacillus silvisoli TaxID=3110539 RepID=UPI00280461E9|nr:helix-turn-helix domain-containing protein [Paenibacillus silvisoli]
MSYAESVQRAIDYIETRLEEELELTSIAEEAYISVAQLYRVFYALTGHPVKDYIRKRRMSVAASHLRHSNCSVESLAYRCGFESYHSFAKVFKKIVGLTPSAYRRAELYYSFEPIRLAEKVAYKEDQEQAERYPDVKVIRFTPDSEVYGYLHRSDRKEGIELEAFRTVQGMLASKSGRAAKPRLFGCDVDLPDLDDGTPQFGYRILLIDADKEAVEELPLFPFPLQGGLYAVRRVAAEPPETVQEGWNRLVAEWLPKSTFDYGEHPCIEEFISYGGKVTRMHLYLPLQRKTQIEPIEIVERAAVKAAFTGSYGVHAQKTAERLFIHAYQSESDSPTGSPHGKSGAYYMSYLYGGSPDDDYWWENGILLPDDASASSIEGGALQLKAFAGGLYACCETKTYGLLTGVLESMHRWIVASGQYRLDEERQWFAEYATEEGQDPEHAIVTVNIPIRKVKD